MLSDASDILFLKIWNILRTTTQGGLILNGAKWQICRQKLSNWMISCDLETYLQNFVCFILLEFYTIRRFFPNKLSVFNI